MRKTTDFHHRHKLWFPYWAMHTHVLIAPEQARVKAAAEAQWVKRPLPSVQAAKKWPYQSLDKYNAFGPLVTA